MRTLRRSVCLVAIGFLIAACGASELEVGVATTTSAPGNTATTESGVATTTTLSTATTLSTEEIDAALAIGEQYVESFNSHDADSVMSLMSSETVFANNFGGEMPRDFWHELLLWNAAQGTLLSDAKCSVFDIERSAILVSCEHGTHDAVSQAVGGPPVPTVTTLTVTSDGIVDLFEKYSSPDFNHVRDPFNSWLAGTHPEVFEAGTLNFAAWADAAEAEANGALVAEYAAEWASYLEENGCTFLDDC